MHARSRRILLHTAGLAVLLFVTALTVTMPASANQGIPFRAFFLSDLPTEHGKIEKLFRSMKDAGADTVIVGPIGSGNLLTKNTLPNVVFLAHQARLKLFVIVQIRSAPETIKSNPEWEDRRYDLRSGSLRTTGKLNLFEPGVLNYIVHKCRTIAEFSVDGIVFDKDILYADMEGFSSKMFEEYEKRFKNELTPGRAFAQIEKVNNEYRVSAYGEGYDNFTRMKQEMVVDSLKAVITACRKVNRSIRFAAPLRFSGIENQLDSLPEYTRDINTYKAADMDYYWMAIPHREELDISYRKGMEVIARTVTVLSMAVKDPRKLVIVLPMVNPAGRLLAYTEIEESSKMAGKGGNPCIAYLVRQSTALPVPLTRKLFKNTNEL